MRYMDAAPTPHEEGLGLLDMESKQGEPSSNRHPISTLNLGNLGNKLVLDLTVLNDYTCFKRRVFGE